MRFRTYKNTDLAVSEVGFGLWTISTGWWGNFTEGEAIRLMQPHIAETDRTIALAEAGNWPPIPDEDIDVVFTAWKNAEPNLASISSADIAIHSESAAQSHIDRELQRPVAHVRDVRRHRTRGVTAVGRRDPQRRDEHPAR